MLLWPLLTAILAGVAMALAGRWLGRRIPSPETRAFAELVDAWRFGGEAERDRAFAGVERVFDLDAPDLDAVRRRARRARMIQAARRFDTLHGRHHWGIRVAALLESRLES